MLGSISFLSLDDLDDSISNKADLERKGTDFDCRLNPSYYSKWQKGMYTSLATSKRSRFMIVA